MNNLKTILICLVIVFLCVACIRKPYLYFEVTTMTKIERVWACNSYVQFGELYLT